jgi:hypothetical protein
VALAAGSRAIYDLVSIESRGLQKIDQCASLWREALAYFEAAEAAWIGVPQDGEALTYHRQALAHFRDLCADRLEIYTIDEPQRCRHSTSRA